MSPVSLTVTVRKVPSRALASPLILIYAFAALIAVGTALLLLPVAHEGSGLTPFMDALFTATSAVTVTGLVIQETSTYWTRTGQVMILGMMFVGGLGFMTIATFLLILIGQRVTLSQRLLVRESLGVDHMGGLVRLTVGIVLVSVVIQMAGFVALVIRFSFLYPPAEAVWQAVFHAVSGFNNAGFIALSEENGLAHFRSDGVVLGTIGVLIILGAISFWVMVDVVRVRRFSLFALTTKLVLVLTATLVVVGTAVFLASEYTNPATLGSLSVGQKLSTSVFESVSGEDGRIYDDQLRRDGTAYQLLPYRADVRRWGVRFGRRRDQSEYDGRRYGGCAVDHAGPYQRGGVRPGDTAPAGPAGDGNWGDLCYVRLHRGDVADLLSDGLRLHRPAVRGRIGLWDRRSQHGLDGRGVAMGSSDHRGHHVHRPSWASCDRPSDGPAY